MKKLMLLFVISISCIVLWAKPLPVFAFSKKPPMIEKDTKLSDYIHTNTPLVKAALIIGEDSVAVGVTIDEFDKIHFINKHSKWSVESDSLPLPVNIDNVAKVILYYPYTHLRPTSDESQNRFQEIRDNADFLGQAEKNNYVVWKYRIHKGVNK